MAESIGSTPTKAIKRVCGSPVSKDQICLLCTKVITNKEFKRKLTTSGGQKKKTKACDEIDFYSLWQLVDKLTILSFISR